MFNRSMLQKTAAVLIALGVWQAAAMLLDQKILLVSPVAVLIRLTNIWIEEGFFASVWFSFCRIVAGFFLALAAGLLLGIVAGKFRKVEIFLWPFILTIKSVPVASFIVLALIWLSSAKLSVFISFLMVLPIIYTNVLNGIKNTDVRMTQMADVFQVKWNRRLLYIWLPQIKPFLLSACSIGLGLSWKAGIAAEIIGIPDGSIGEALYNAKVYFNTVDLFSWTVIIVVISILFEKLFMMLLKQMFAGWERL
ncbi:MAG TPA: nitrate ABC transporter permease [Clostridiales bacterium]|nr:nitrate ABC transporter permease [Clostridiales bacterium]